MKIAFNIFTLLLGRFPFWVLIAVFFTNKNFNFGALLVFFFAAALAKGFLYAHKYNKGQGFYSLYLLYGIFRPLLLIILAGIVYFGILYALFAGSFVDTVILLTAFAFFIANYALGMFIKRSDLQTNTLLNRGSLFRIVIALLWLYFILQPDGQTAAISVLFLIYVLEYVSTFEIFTAKPLKYNYGNKLTAAR